MKERVVIIFIALVFGLLATTIAFYIYQSTKVIPKEESKKANITAPNQISSASKATLFIDEPKDESLSDRRTIQVKGKTNPSHTIVVSSNTEDVVATPTKEGTFAVTIGIDAGANRITIRSISPNGDETKEERTITFSQEEF